jgi:hypothetical protein
MTKDNRELILNLSQYNGSGEHIYFRQEVGAEERGKITTQGIPTQGIEYDRVDCYDRDQDLLEQILVPIKGKLMAPEATRYMELAAQRYYQNNRLLTPYFKLKGEGEKDYQLSKQGLWILESGLTQLNLNVPERGRIKAQALSFQLTQAEDTLFNYALARKIFEDGTLKIDIEVIPYVPSQTATTLGVSPTIEIKDEHIVLDNTILEGSQLLLDERFNEEATALEGFLKDNGAAKEEMTFWRRQLWEHAETLLNATKRKTMVVPKK